jgi:hypothetical protein
MHRQVASLLSTNSPGRLAKLGNALGAAKIDIMTTGGAEWLHSGPVTLIIKRDWGVKPNEIDDFAIVMEQEGFPWLAFRTIEVDLSDVPGSLGAAATALGDINIYAVTILKPGKTTTVGLGVRPSRVADAIDALKDFSPRLRRHPKDPSDDGWHDAWDDRTERLLDWFEKNPGASPSDPVFYGR